MMRIFVLLIMTLALFQTIPGFAGDCLRAGQDSLPQNCYYSCREIMVRVDDSVEISGTLTIPDQGAKKYPVVVILSGTGKQDRDGTFANHKPFKMIAEYLAQRGIAVLRTDDRGVGKSGGVYEEATTSDFASDALKAVTLLKNRPDINPGKIGLFGHSEGGAAAMIVAATSPDIAFVISVAGLSTDGLTALKLQNAAIINAARNRTGEWKKMNIDFLNQLFDWVAEVSQNEDLVSPLTEKYNRWLSQQTDSTLKILGVKFREDIYLQRYLRSANTRWYREMIAYDPARYVPLVKVPVLAINGDMDVMVPADENLANLELLLKRGGNECYRMIKLPGLNHMMQHCTYGTPEEIPTLEDTFADEALNVIDEWLKEILK